MKIEFDVKNCEHCPFVKSERYYTPDSFEDVWTLYCEKANHKKIGVFDWNDKVIIPNWCPCKAV